MKSAITIAMLFSVLVNATVYAQEQHNHEEGHDDHDGVELTQEQIQRAGVTVSEVSPSAVIDDSLLVPGEVRQNGYTSYLVSPRVDSIVLKRHVALGEHIKQGQPLVSLFSEAVAEAQAQYIDSVAEYQRLKNIGLGAVSDKQIKESQTAYQSAFARLNAYGLSEKKIRSLNVNSTNLGEYLLSAETDGTVLADDFNQGQRLMAGEEIMQIADEHQLWVEARLPPGNTLNLPADTEATVLFYQHQFKAKVAQEAHTIDPVTRTRIVRLLVDNSAHQLHPGMFVEVSFTTTENAAIQVPETALVRQQNGGWAVFIEHEPGRYELQPVEREKQLGKTVTVRGLQAGEKVVMTGAFFIASEAAKGGFDPHNH